VVSVAYECSSFSRVVGERRLFFCLSFQIDRSECAWSQKMHLVKYVDIGRMMRSRDLVFGRCIRIPGSL